MYCSCFPHLKLSIDFPVYFFWVYWCRGVRVFFGAISCVVVRIQSLFYFIAYFFCILSDQYHFNLVAQLQQLHVINRSFIGLDLRKNLFDVV